MDPSHRVENTINEDRWTDRKLVWGNMPPLTSSVEGGWRDPLQFDIFQYSLPNI